MKDTQHETARARKRPQTMEQSELPPITISHSHPNPLSTAWRRRVQKRPGNAQKRSTVDSAQRIATKTGHQPQLPAPRKPLPQPGVQLRFRPSMTLPHMMMRTKTTTPITAAQNPPPLPPLPDAFAKCRKPLPAVTPSASYQRGHIGDITGKNPPTATTDRRSQQTTLQQRTPTGRPESSCLAAKGIITCITSGAIPRGNPRRAGLVSLPLPTCCPSFERQRRRRILKRPWRIKTQNSLPLCPPPSRPCTAPMESLSLACHLVWELRPWTPSFKG